MEKQSIAERGNEAVYAPDVAVSDATQEDFAGVRNTGANTEKVARKLARVDGQGGGQTVLRRSILTSVKSNQQRATIARSVVQRQQRNAQASGSVVVTNISSIGQKTDHLYGDLIPASANAPLPPGVKDVQRFRRYRQMNNAQLLQEMRNQFAQLIAGGALENAMITRFFNGGGGWWDHAPGSQLSNALARSSAVEDVVKRLSWQCSDQLRSGRSVSSLRVDIGTPNFYSIFNDQLARALYGGTAGMKLTLSNVNWQPPRLMGVVQGRLSGRVSFELTDVFGLDHDDVYHPYLLAMWILQHERRGPQPFFNRARFTKTFWANGAEVFVGDR